MSSRLFAASLCYLITVAQTAVAESRVLRGATGVELQKWVDQLSTDSLRPTWIQACPHQGKVLFCAIAERDSTPREWRMRHGLSQADFQKVFDANLRDGFRMVCCSGYLAGNADQFAAIWIKDSEGVRWEARSFLTVDEYQKRFDAAVQNKLVPLQVAQFRSSAGIRMAAIFTSQNNLQFVARHNLTADQYQQFVDERSPQGFRPADLSVTATEGGPRFTTIFVKDAIPWAAHHGFSQEQIDDRLSAYARTGLQPICLDAYVDGNQLRYAAVWKQAEVPEPPPVGALPANYEPLDKAIRQFMSERRIPGGELAVGHRGKLQLARGYGYATPDHSRQVQPHDLFRIASVSKPITAALVRKLAAEGRLDLQTPAFELIGAQPLPSQTVDARLKQITVQHLLDHQGGWIRGETFDPMFRSTVIAKELGRPAPATALDVIQYMLGQPLQFDPGRHTGKGSERYSNFGYCVLGRVIERVTGQSYFEALQGEILRDRQITEITLGRTLPQFRDPREPVYVSPGLAPSVFVTDREELVPWPDGGFHLEAMDSHGGLIASAPALVEFFRDRWVSGQPRGAEDVPQEWVALGALDGTAALLMQHAGFDVAVLLNQRIQSEDNTRLADSIREALKSVD